MLGVGDAFQARKLLSSWQHFFFSFCVYGTRSRSASFSSFSSRCVGVVAFAAALLFFTAVQYLLFLKFMLSFPLFHSPSSNCSLHFHCCHFLVPSALPFCLRVVTFFFLLWFHTPFSSHHRSITKCVSQLTQTFPPPLLADLSNHADPCCLGCSGCRCPRAEPPSPQHS